MPHPAEFLSDEKFFDHFILAGSEDQDVLCAFSAFHPIAGALLGLPRQEAERRYFDVAARGPGYDPRQTSLTSDVLAIYRHLVPDSADTIFIHPVMAADRYQVLTQELVGSNRYRISYWVSTSAITASISLLFAHCFHLASLKAQRAGTPEVIEATKARVEHYSLLCRYLNAAATDGGSYCLLDVDTLPCIENTSNLCREIFLSALMFLVFHELGHVRHGHLSARESALPVDEKRAHETAADAFALGHSFRDDWLTPWSCLLGALAALLGDSLTSARLDSIDGPVHPSLVKRARNLCELYDQLRGRPLGDSWSFATPFIKNLVVALFDRDRCPCWFGQDRRAVLGLPPDYDFDAGPRRNFSSADGGRTTDANPSPPKSKPFQWKAEPQKP